MPDGKLLLFSQLLLALLRRVMCVCVQEKSQLWSDREVEGFTEHLYGRVFLRRLFISSRLFSEHGSVSGINRSIPEVSSKSPIYPPFHLMMMMVICACALKCVWGEKGWIPWIWQFSFMPNGRLLDLGRHMKAAWVWFERFLCPGKKRKPYNVYIFFVADSSLIVRHSIVLF